MKKALALLLAFSVLIPLLSLGESEETSILTVTIEVEPALLWDTNSGILADGDQADLTKVGPSRNTTSFRLFGTSVPCTVLLPDMQETANAMVSLDKRGMFLPQKGLVITFTDQTSCILLNASVDASFTRIADWTITRLVQKYTDIEVMVTVPVRLYLNGQYWGQYHMLTLGASYQDKLPAADQIIDEDSLLDWLAVKVFFGDGEIRLCWCYAGDDDVWHCVVSGMDMGLYNASYNTYNMLNGNPYFRQVISRNQERFLTKLGALFRVMTVDVMQAELDACAHDIQPEMQAHFDRWAHQHDQVMIPDWPTEPEEAYEFWLLWLSRCRDYTIVNRPAFVYQQTQEYFKLSDEEMTDYFN